MSDLTARNLIQRLADELDHYKQLLMDDRRETHALAQEARAFLAQPESEGPTDGETFLTRHKYADWSPQIPHSNRAQPS